MKLTKLQLERFEEQLAQRRDEYIIDRSGTAPDEYEMSEGVMLKQIADGIAKLKPNVEMYTQLQHAFEFVLSPEAEAMQETYKAWRAQNIKVRDEAHTRYEAALNKLIFAGTGEDVMKLLEDTFKD